MSNIKISVHAKTYQLRLFMGERIYPFYVASSFTLEMNFLVNEEKN